MASITQDMKYRLSLIHFAEKYGVANAAKGKKFYQYTAINEYSRWSFVKAFEEHSTYSSSQFLEHLIQHFPVPIKYVQTDNGMEFTKRFSTSGKETLTLFQRKLQKHGISHKLNRPLRHAIMERWNSAIERIMNAFMYSIPFILSRTLPDRSRFIIAGIIIAYLFIFSIKYLYFFTEESQRAPDNSPS